MTTSLSRPPTLSTTTADERAITTLVAAFASDPIIRWFFPDTADYLTAFPNVLRLFGPAACPQAIVDRRDDGGAAIWQGPGATVDAEALGHLTATHVDTARQPPVFTFLEQLTTHHPDPDTIWYLPFIGVDPAAQGRGLGSDLLQRGLARVDQDRFPAYLEASSPRNRALYERHGFAVITEFQVADSPPMWPMLRPARSVGPGGAS